MLKIVTRLLLSILTGANVATIALMLAVGYSDRINPVAHPTLGCAGMFFPFFIVANLLFLVVWLIVRWRRAWIPIVGFALAYSPIRTYIPLHFGQQSTEGALKIVSYNVAGYDANRDKGALDVIAQWIEREQPDIVCLQEDMSPRGQDPYGRLRQLYDYNDTVHVNGVRQAYINALGIHSRFPILRSERIGYDSDTNGSAAFYLLVDGDTVVVVNNHLESTHLSPEERQRYKDVLKGEMESDSARKETQLLINKISSQMALRAPQAEAVSRYVATCLGHYPVIVCGDFNDTPISYVRHTIAQGLQDCFVEAGCGLGLSYNQKGFYFRIDHILCSDDFLPVACHVDSKIDASDHFPLVCWLRKVDKP